MREVIKTAKTVEEATELCLAELGVSAEEAFIEVLELPQRRFFRTVPARVRAFLEEEPAPAPAPARAEKPAAPAKAEKAPAPARAEKPAAPAKAEKTAAPARAEKTPAPAKAEKPAAPAREEQAEAKAEKPAQPEETAEPIDLSTDEKAREAVAYLRSVCAGMGADALEITPVRQNGAIVLRVEGESAGMLIGHRGEVMEALSYLTGLVANRAGGEYTKLSLDINHYRSKREANLTTLARRIGAKVARTGRGHTLEPMNPYERRIIHSAISEMEGVRSESIGEGANRRVVISCTDPNVRPPRENRGGPRGAQRGGRPSGGRGPRGPRPGGERMPRTSTPAREFADRPRDPNAAPTVPKRTETVNDGADLPLYGKIEL